MRRHYRKLALILALWFGFMSSSFAFWTFLAGPVTTSVMWLGRAAASNVTMAKAVEWSLYSHGAVLGYLSWKNSSDTTPQNSSPIKANLVVQPNPAAKRDNPDANKFNDATVRDPTPKDSFTINAGLPAMPANWGAVVTDMGGEGQKSYSSGNYQRDITVTKTPAAGTTYSWQGSVTVNGTSAYYYVLDKTTVLTCPNGYVQNSTTCTLTVPANVTKPAGKVPCEVIANSDGTWEVDSKNPECANQTAQVTTSGKKITVTRVSGSDYDEITKNDDGSLKISTRGPGGNRDINTGPYSPSYGGWPISDITDNPGGPGQTTTSNGGGSSGSGSTGTGSTGTGSGGGSCGGSGQPPCAIDDSGFNGKDGSLDGKVDAALAKFDDREKQIKDTDDHGTFGIEKDWIPNLKPGPSVSCQPLNWAPAIAHGPLSGLTGSVDVQWCDKVDIFREYLGWLFGVSTVVAIALLFFGSNRPGGGKE